MEGPRKSALRPATQFVAMECSLSAAMRLAMTAITWTETVVTPPAQWSSVAIHAPRTATACLYAHRTVATASSMPSRLRSAMTIRPAALVTASWRRARNARVEANAVLRHARSSPRRRHAVAAVGFVAPLGCAWSRPAALGVLMGRRYSLVSERLRTRVTNTASSGDNAET